jgi:hypothetical protein
MLTAKPEKLHSKRLLFVEKGHSVLAIGQNVERSWNKNSN